MHRKRRKKVLFERVQGKSSETHFLVIKKKKTTKKPKQIITYLQLEHSSNTLCFELAVGIKTKIEINVSLE